MWIRLPNPGPCSRARNIEWTHLYRPLKGDVNISHQWLRIAQSRLLVYRRQIRIDPINQLGINPYRLAMDPWPEAHQRNPDRRTIIDPWFILPSLED